MALESELKFELTEPEYELLLSSSPHHEAGAREWENFYFDSPDWKLLSRKVGLRIRTAGSEHTLTVKLPATETSTTPGLNIRQEFECPLEPQTSQPLLANQTHILSLDVEPIAQLRKSVSELPSQVSCRGSIWTRRSYLRLGKWAGELDYSRCVGKPFWELEIETTSAEEALNWVTQYFKSLGIQLRPSQTSKLERFHHYCR